MLFSEEELDKLLREGQSATPVNAFADNQVDCYEETDHMMLIT